MTRKIEKNGKYKFDTTARHGENGRRLQILHVLLARDAVALPGVSKPQSDVHLHLQSADRTTVFFEALPGRGKEDEEGVCLSIMAELPLSA